MLSTTMTKVPVANYGWLHEHWMLFVLSGNILIQITPVVNQKCFILFLFLLCDYKESGRTKQRNYNR